MYHHINIIILHKYLARVHVTKTLMYLAVPNKSLLWKKKKRRIIPHDKTKIRERKRQENEKGCQIYLVSIASLSNYYI